MDETDRGSRPVLRIAQNGIVAALWVVLLNGLIVGSEIYSLFNETALSWFACAGWVALGELIATALGYALFMVLVRRRAFMDFLKPTRHIGVTY